MLLVDLTLSVKCLTIELFVAALKDLHQILRQMLAVLEYISYVLFVHLVQLVQVVLKDVVFQFALVIKIAPAVKSVLMDVVMLLVEDIVQRERYAAVVFV